MSRFEELLASFAITKHARGCTDQEIASIVTDQEVVPDSYLHFLKVAGHGLQDFLPGSDVFLVQLKGVREAANGLLAESGLEALPSNAFVFLMHQGYEFLFFQEGRVFFYIEGADAVKELYGSFEEFFESVVNNVYDRHRVIT